MLKDFVVQVLKNIFGIIGFITPILSGLSWKYNAVFIVGGLLITAIIHLLFKLNEIDHKKYLKVTGQVQGNGIFSDINIIKIESNSKIPKDTLLTLISKGNGLVNSICILKIIESIKDEEIQAIQFLPNPNKLDIFSYFVDTNKLANLFVTVIVKETDFITLININNEDI